MTKLLRITYDEKNKDIETKLNELFFEDLPHHHNIQVQEVRVEDMDEVLLACQRAIEDAIGLEDGLDGSAGEAVLGIIADYRKKYNMGQL